MVSWNHETTDDMACNRSSEERYDHRLHACGAGWHPARRLATAALRVDAQQVRGVRLPIGRSLTSCPTRPHRLCLLCRHWVPLTPIRRVDQRVLAAKTI